MYTTTRYDVFNNIHKALRGMLFDVQLKMQRCDFDSPEATPLIAELEQVLEYFDEHADHEDRHILANIIAHEPQLAGALEEDHVVDHELSSWLRTLIEAWTLSPDPLAAKAIFYAFNEFIAFNLYHMNKEEKQLLPLLWKHFSDADIHGMEQQILADIDPQTLMAESRWMMRSISDNEIRGWMGGIRQGAPAHVYGLYLQMAGEELAVDRFAALGLEPAVA